MVESSKTRLYVSLPLLLPAKQREGTQWTMLFQSLLWISQVVWVIEIYAPKKIKLNLDCNLLLGSISVSRAVDGFHLIFTNTISFLFGKILISTIQLNFNTPCTKLNWEDLDYATEHFISLLVIEWAYLHFFSSCLRLNCNPQREKYKCLHNTLFLIYTILTLFKCYIYIIPKIIFTGRKPF